MPPMLRERRFTFPHPALADARLEPIMQPLYSAAVYDNAALSTQRELFFFRYAIGGQVSGLAAAAGTVPATVLHTNMDTAGFLAAPKVFLVKGCRLVIPGINSTLSDVKTTNPQTGETPVEHDLADMLEVLYGTYFRFFVGTKDYLNVPTFMVPGNVGVGGLMETDVMAPAAAGPFQHVYVSANSNGQYAAMTRNGDPAEDHSILIPPQQNFFCSLNASQATPPTVAAECLVYAVLDGVFGREVQ